MAVRGALAKHGSWPPPLPCRPYLSGEVFHQLKPSCVKPFLADYRLFTQETACLVWSWGTIVVAKFWKVLGLIFQRSSRSGRQTCPEAMAAMAYALRWFTELKTDCNLHYAKCPEGIRKNWLLDVTIESPIIKSPIINPQGKSTEKYGLYAKRSLQTRTALEWPSQGTHNRSCNAKEGWMISEQC